MHSGESEGQRGRYLSIGIVSDWFNNNKMIDESYENIG
jgi:hypothetical protein